MPNRLADESSPYLLQHAHNPVDWRPWGEEAFAEARERDVPVLLSIGYSACHWCHVMERESFEDPATAELMNQAFVNIKVDREERPDVDSVYMRAVQSMSGHGGWPLTAFLTPAGEPFYGGTYFPPEPRHGTPSFVQVLTSIQNAYKNRRDEVLENAGNLKDLLERSTTEQGEGPVTAEGEKLEGESLLRHAVRFLSSRFDTVNGGFGGAPKFPQPVTLELALRIYARTGEEQVLDMVTHTLRKMAHGGIRDHLAGGFHRYSVDAHWLVPHFEKMLYDNALLARIYLAGFQLTGAADLRDVAERTLDYLLADMRSPEGGFYSATDADSEGEEGLFYMWTPDQIRERVEPEAARLFQRCYDVSEAGNFEGRNILHLPHEIEAVAQSEGMEADDLRSCLEDAGRVLLDARGEREPPLRDEKILASWNGMALRAFAEAGGALGRPDYVEAAVQGLNFVLSNMRANDRLLRSYKDGRARIDAFLEDYGAMGNALLTAYEVTLDPHWLDEVRWMADHVIELFWDEDAGLFYDSSKDGEALVVRPRAITDDATPSGNSLAVELLLRTAHLFGDDGHRDIAERVLAGESGSMARFPSAFGRLLSALDQTVAAPVEIAVVGNRDDPRTAELLGATLSLYLPHRTVAGRAPGEDIHPSIPLLEGREAEAGRPTAWVCEGYSCKAPVHDADAVLELLRGRIGG